jgi:hypothetical protein
MISGSGGSRMCQALPVSNRSLAPLDSRSRASIVGLFSGTANNKDVTPRGSTPLPTDPVAWWRNSYQRDRDAFERAHGRRPETLLELSTWLSRIPIRAEPRPRQ